MTIEYYNASNFMKLTEQEALQVPYVLVCDTSGRYMTYDLMVNEIESPKNDMYVTVHNLNSGMEENLIADMNDKDDYLVRTFINQRLSNCAIIRGKNEG